MSYEDITDSSNPFATSGLSREVRALLEYLRAAGQAAGGDFVATSTTDHPTYSNARNLSRHLRPGTDGLGLALDCRLRTRGTGRNHHRAVFDAFTHVETQLHELIYAFAPYNIKAGERVAPYAVSDHKDHIHVSVGKGVFVAYPSTPGRPTPEELMASIPDACSRFCVLANDDLVITTVSGAIYHYDADGNADPLDHADAYAGHPELGGSVRKCLGVYAIGPDRKVRPDGHAEAVGYCQVFDDGARYHWVR